MLRKPVNNVEILEGNIIKQGDTQNPFVVRLLDADGNPVNVSSYPVTWSLASPSGKLFEKDAIKGAGTGVLYLYISSTDPYEAGDMRIEITVNRNGLTEKYPSQNWLPVLVTSSLDDLSGTPVSFASINYFEEEVTAAKKVAYEASLETNQVRKIALDAVSKSKYTQKQMDQIAGASTIDPAVEQAKVGYDGTTYDSLDARLRKEYENLFKLTEYRKLQSYLYTTVFRKLRLFQPVEIDCGGDSMTYGHDEYSADNRPPSTEITPDNYGHVAKRASVTYPEALQTFMNQVYGEGVVTVKNKGYSGGTTENAYPMWTRNDNTDLAILCYGINDSNKYDAETFLYWYRKIIERYLDWGTAIVLLTTPRIASKDIINPDTFDNAIYQLGKEYGIPVIDSDVMMRGYGREYNSDGVHFNGRGYMVWASRIASILLGDGVLRMPKVYSGSSLGPIPKRDSITTNIIPTSDNNAPTPDESTAYAGDVIKLTKDSGGAYYTFYAETGDMIILPGFRYFKNQSTYIRLRMTLDFGVEQALPQNQFDNGFHVPNYDNLNQYFVDYEYPDDRNSNASPSEAFIPSRFKIGQPYLMVTQSGYHTIKVECFTDGDGYVNFHGLAATSRTKIGSQTDSLELYMHKDSVPESRVKISDLEWATGIKIGLTFSMHPPIKITVHNYGQRTYEYAVQLGQYTDAAQFKLSTEVREFNYGSTPNETLIRKLSAISYDTSTKELVLTWAGATNRETIVSISVL